MIRFSDGETFDPTGEYRVEMRKDGYYVLGGNIMNAVDTYEEGIDFIRKMDPNAPIVISHDKAKASKPREFFETGRQFKIVRDGGSISGWKPMGPGCQQGWRCELKVGDIVTYRGWQYSGGSDGISCRSFSTSNEEGTAKGIFWPNNWGSVDKSFFEPLD